MKYCAKAKEKTEPGPHPEWGRRLVFLTPSTVRTTPIKGRFIDYIDETFLSDAFIGLGAWVVIAPVALLLGGFRCL